MPNIVKRMYKSIKKSFKKLIPRKRSSRYLVDSPTRSSASRSSVSRRPSHRLLFR